MVIQDPRTGHGRPHCGELREPQLAPSSTSQQPEPLTQPQLPLHGTWTLSS